MSGPFFWAVGVENTCLGSMGVDQLGWTAHRQRWRQDLELARQTGATHIRYGLPWSELNPAPDRYNWSWSDAAVDWTGELGLEVIWDLVHFDSPSFLPEGWTDPHFAQALGRYAGAFAARYAGRVNWITPLNEPYISTYFRAGWGIWPPHWQGRAGFARLLPQTVAGVRAAVAAIRQANPEAQIWLNDAADHFHPATPNLEEEARFRTLQRYAALDILLGLAQPGHPTQQWLLEAGCPAHLFEADPIDIDVLGLDYYPETEHLLLYNAQNEIEVRPMPLDRQLGLAHALQAYHQRYGLPLFIAETSATQAPLDWLAYTVQQVQQALQAGVPLRGYTWWPLFDFYDWDSLLTRLEGSLCPVGLYSLQDGPSSRRATPALQAFQRLARGGYKYA